MVTIFVRTVITYVVLLISMRLMGKRQVGELEVSELIVTFMLSELAAFSITDDRIPFIFSLIPIMTLLSLEVLGSFLITKNKKLKEIFLGHPTLIIKKGKLNIKELSKNRISIEELMSQLRLKSISAFEDVEYAILEQNGQLSVITKTDASPLNPKDAQIKTDEKGIAHGLILDGFPNEQNLMLAGKNLVWLKKKMKEKGLEIKDVFLYTLDDAENEFLIKKDKEK